LKINWLWGWSLKNQNYVLILEQLVYYYDEDEKRKESRYIYESSNGAALGSSIEEALLYGMFEVIERDNFLVSFYNKLPLVEIDIQPSKLKHINAMIKYLEKDGFSIHFFDISMELKIPAVWCLIVDKSENTVVKTYSAAGCHFNPEKAIESSFFEVVSSVPVYEDIFSKKDYLERKELIFKNPKLLTEFEDHVLYYSHEKSLEKYDFLFPITSRKRIDELYPEWFESEKYKNHDLNDDIKTLVNEILSYYEDIYVINLSSSQLEEMGLCCVKVLIPGMQPVTFGVQYERKIKQRIMDALSQVQKQKRIDFSGFNENPHPFP